MSASTSGLCSIVTGGAGFIGSHLVDRLVEAGHRVIIIDNLCNGQLRNIEHLKDNPQVRLEVADINDFERIAPLFEGVDQVYHLAALADIVPSIQQPVDYHRANVDGTISVLEAARKAGIKRFVYAASSSCYGIPDSYPTAEDADIRPMYPYALTKYLGEWYVMHWAQTYSMSAVALRLFNVYGTRSRTNGAYGAVFGVFLAQKLAGKPFTVIGDGTQTRDFTYVTDVADAFYTAGQSDVSGTYMNMGSCGTYSVNNLVGLLGGEITYIPKRPGEPDCTFADTKRIEALLGWKPKVSFEDGVAKVLDNIEYWREAVVWTPDTIKEATKDWFTYLGGKTS